MQRPPAPPPIVHGGGPGTAQNPSGLLSQNGALGAGMRPPQAAPTDPGVDAVVTNIKDIMNHIEGLLVHIEGETSNLSWTVIMDRFSLISSQMSNLAKYLKSERVPDFRKTAIVPYMLSPDLDPAVKKLTDGRVDVLSHENAVHYLRTKLDPEVESRFGVAYDKGPPIIPSEASTKADKQITSLNKLASSLLELIQGCREELDSKAASKQQLPPTCNSADTTAIVTAITTGEGLPPAPPYDRNRPGPASSASGLAPR